jgi:hypothetical protein
MSLPKFKVAQPKIGATPFVGTPFCAQGSTDEQQRGDCVKKYRAGKTTTYKTYADKYLTEQYVRVTLKLEELTGMKKCLDNMEIQVNYSDLSKQHTCNSAIYEIFLNGVKLTREDGKLYASLNNQGNTAYKYKGIDKYDNDINNVGGKRLNKFFVTPEIASQILTSTISKLPSGQKPSFILSAKCINPFGVQDPKWKDGCHVGVGNVVVINGQKQRYDYVSATPDGKNQTKTLASFDACGSGKAQ